MAALATRIRKMVPASRLVTDASLEPPDSIARMRASSRVGTSVAGGASMAVTKFLDRPPCCDHQSRLSTIR
jgi:hypothetical protein